MAHPNHCLVGGAGFGAGRAMPMAHRQGLGGESRIPLTSQATRPPLRSNLEKEYRVQESAYAHSEIDPDTSRRYQPLSSTYGALGAPGKWPGPPKNRTCLY